MNSHVDKKVSLKLKIASKSKPKDLNSNYDSIGGAPRVEYTESIQSRGKNNLNEVREVVEAAQISIWD